MTLTQERVICRCIAMLPAAVVDAIIPAFGIMSEWTIFGAVLTVMCVICAKSYVD